MKLYILSFLLALFLIDVVSSLIKSQDANAESKRDKVGSSEVSNLKFGDLH